MRKCLVIVNAHKEFITTDEIRRVMCDCIELADSGIYDCVIATEYKIGLETDNYTVVDNVARVVDRVVPATSSHIMSKAFISVLRDFDIDEICLVGIGLDGAITRYARELILSNIKTSVYSKYCIVGHGESIKVQGIQSLKELNKGITIIT